MVNIEQTLSPSPSTGVCVRTEPRWRFTSRLWDRNITITTRLVDTACTPMPLSISGARKLNPKRLITHRFKLDRILDAYETFANAASAHSATRNSETMKCPTAWPLTS